MSFHRISPLHSQLQKIGVVDSPDEKGQYKVMMDRETFDDKIRRFKELSEKGHPLSWFPQHDCPLNRVYSASHGQDNKEVSFHRISPLHRACHF